MSTLQLKEQRLWLMTPIISLFSIYVWYLPKLFIIFATCVLLLAWRYSDLAESPRRKLFLSVTILLSSLELFLYFDAQFSRDTSVCLMIAMCVFKWFEIRSPRDYLIIIYLYFFLAITVFLYHQSLLMSCYVACIIVNIFFTWAHIHLKQKQIRWNLSRPVVRLVLLALPGSILIFLLLPRLHYPLFWFGSTTNHAVSGLSERMLPGAISSLSLSNEISFRAKFSQEIPDRRDLYWRVLVLTRTDGISWDQHPKPLSEKIELPQTTGQKYTYQLILEASGKHWIPALDLPVTVPPEVQQAEAFQLRSMTALSQRTLYQLQSSVLHRDLNADITALQQQRFIPPHLNPLARALAGAWRRQAHHDRDIIEAAKEYFQRRGFR